MSTTFSTYAMEAMGFHEMIQQGAIVASFMSVTVYEARGISLPEGFADALEASIAGANYRIALARDVNVGCQALVGEDFSDAESDWCKKVNSNGPFVLIAVGPTDFFECNAGRLMRQTDGSFITYDSFPHLRETLKNLEHRVLPPVIAAVTCALNESDLNVVLRKLERASMGKCTDGTQIQDLRFDVKAHGYVSRSIDKEIISNRLIDVTKRAPTLNQRAARFLALGVTENDHLKRFLYFFLAIEVETHAVFSRIDHKMHTTQLLSGENTPSAATLRLLSSQVAASNTLFDRFVWCSACIWKDLLDADINLFKELKSARDAIAHGRSSEPPSGYDRKAEIIARKILWR